MYKLLNENYQNKLYINLKNSILTSDKNEISNCFYQILRSEHIDEKQQETRNNIDIDKIKKIYKDNFNKDLEDELSKYTNISDFISSVKSVDQKINIIEAHPWVSVNFPEIGLKSISTGSEGEIHRRHNIYFTIKNINFPNENNQYSASGFINYWKNLKNLFINLSNKFDDLNIEYAQNGLGVMSFKTYLFKAKTMLLNNDTFNRIMFDPDNLKVYFYGINRNTNTKLKDEFLTKVKKIVNDECNKLDYKLVKRTRAEHAHDFEAQDLNIRTSFGMIVSVFLTIIILKDQNKSIKEKLINYIEDDDFENAKKIILKNIEFAENYINNKDNSQLIKKFIKDNRSLF